MATNRTLALAAVGLMVAATTAACSHSSTGSSSTGSSSTGSSSSTAAAAAETGVIAGLDYGPLVGLIGTWKSAPNGGVDVAPGQAGSKVGKGKRAVSPYYETITYTPAGGAVNASDQQLAALYYRQQVFAKIDNKQFHDQTGYLIYDKIGQKVYDTFCIPRGVCVVAEGAPGTTMTLKTQSQGVAQTQYMLKNDSTEVFSITFTLSGNTLKYDQTTDLQVYGKPFSHTDSDTLKKTAGSLTFVFDRLGGTDRYATSVATAQQFGHSTDVILASGVPGHYPDALTASYLAGFKKAPIMLTQLAATPANVIAQITASGATDVWLIGGTGVISTAQEAALDVKFGTIHRLGGLDRYLTAEKVIGAAGVAASTTHTAVLATGVNFPDAIAGGPLSYVKGMPLAITATNSVPASTLAALKAAGVTNVIALGGPTVITPAVLATLAAQTPSITLNQRIYGANRSETSSKLADYMLASQGFTNTGINVASGYAFGTGADALGGAPLSGKENRPTLITESVTTVGPGPLGFLTAHSATLASGHIFGGLGAVSQASEDAMEAAARYLSIPG